jgi:heat shock protein HslJ
MNIKPLIPILFILILFTSCKKDVDIDFRVNNWKVLKLKESGSSKFLKPDSTYILKFISNNAFNFNTDVNECWGSYEVTSPGNITINNEIGCTFVCCDTDFAQKMIQLFPMMTSYYGKGDRLFFEGENGSKIVLTKN